MTKEIRSERFALLFTQLIPASLKGDCGNLCKPRVDTTSCGIWLESTLFVLYAVNRFNFESELFSIVTRQIVSRKRSLRKFYASLIANETSQRSGKINSRELAFHWQNAKINSHENKWVYSLYKNDKNRFNQMPLKWATSWENLYMPNAKNKGADQPAYPCSLISTFVVCCQDSIIPLLAIAEISRL